MPIRSGSLPLKRHAVAKIKIPRPGPDCLPGRADQSTQSFLAILPAHGAAPGKHHPEQFSRYQFPGPAMVRRLVQTLYGPAQVFCYPCH
jgi:hypothetical protein